LLRGALCAALAAELGALFLLAKACADAAGRAPGGWQLQHGLYAALLAVLAILLLPGWRRAWRAAGCRYQGMVGAAGGRPRVALAWPDGRTVLADIASSWDFGGALLLLALRPVEPGRGAARPAGPAPRLLALHRRNTSDAALRAVRRAVRSARH